jgi:hypothetical protein
MTKVILSQKRKTDAARKTGILSYIIRVTEAFQSSMTQERGNHTTVFRILPLDRIYVQGDGVSGYSHKDKSAKLARH